METTRRLKSSLRLGAWTLGRPIATGGQGEVWEVRPANTGHTPPRAMKVCLADNQQARDRFAQEVELLRGLKHPGVIPILDAKVDWQTEPTTKLAYSFYVTERFDSSLADLPWLHEAPLYALRLFREVCDALTYIHTRESPIIHRDLKPTNILLGSEPRRVAVADFGVARSDDEERIPLTRTHEVVGTKYYRAPETLMGSPATIRSDVYSLGRTLEWLLTGRDPNETDPRPVPQHNELTRRACRALDEVVARACQMDPRHRFGAVSDLKNALPELRAALPQELNPKARASATSASVPTMRQGAPTEHELRELLADHDGNIASVAALFGKERQQVYRWMDRYGIKAEDFRGQGASAPEIAERAGAPEDANPQVPAPTDGRPSARELWVTAQPRYTEASKRLQALVFAPEIDPGLSPVAYKQESEARARQRLVAQNDLENVRRELEAEFDGAGR